MSDKKNECYVCFEQCTQPKYFECSHLIHYGCLKNFYKIRYTEEYSCLVCSSSLNINQQHKIHTMINNIRENSNYNNNYNKYYNNNYITTKEEQNQFERLGYQSCPTCKFWIEKIDGCSTVKCAMCGNKFIFNNDMKKYIDLCFFISMLLIGMLIIIITGAKQYNQDIKLITTLDKNNIKLTDYQNIIVEFEHNIVQYSKIHRITNLEYSKFYKIYIENILYTAQYINTIGTINKINDYNTGNLDTGNLDTGNLDTGNLDEIDEKNKIIILLNKLVDLVDNNLKIIEIYTCFNNIKILSDDYCNKL